MKKEKEEITESQSEIKENSFSFILYLFTDPTIIYVFISKKKKVAY